MLPKSGGVSVPDMSRDLCMDSGIIYPVLQKLEEKGLISSWFEDKPFPRPRLYQLTWAGRLKIADTEAQETSNEFRKKV